MEPSLEHPPLQPRHDERPQLSFQHAGVLQRFQANIRAKLSNSRASPGNLSGVGSSWPTGVLSTVVDALHSLDHSMRKTPSRHSSGGSPTWTRSDALLWLSDELRRTCGAAAEASPPAVVATSGGSSVLGLSNDMRFVYQEEGEGSEEDQEGKEGKPAGKTTRERKEGGTHTHHANTSMINTIPTSAFVHLTGDKLCEEIKIARAQRRESAANLERLQMRQHPPPGIIKGKARKGDDEEQRDEQLDEQHPVQQQESQSHQEHQPHHEPHQPQQQKQRQRRPRRLRQQRNSMWSPPLELKSYADYSTIMRSPSSRTSAPPAFSASASASASASTAVAACASASARAPTSDSASSAFTSTLSIGNLPKKKNKKSPSKDIDGASDSVSLPTNEPSRAATGDDECEDHPEPMSAPTTPLAALNRSLRESGNSEAWWNDDDEDNDPGGDHRVRGSGSMGDGVRAEMMPADIAASIRSAREAKEARRSGEVVAPTAIMHEGRPASEERPPLRPRQQHQPQRHHPRWRPPALKLDQLLGGDEDLNGTLPAALLSSPRSRDVTTTSGVVAMISPLARELAADFHELLREGDGGSCSDSDNDTITAVAGSEVAFCSYDGEITSGTVRASPRFWPDTQWRSGSPSSSPSPITTPSTPSPPTYTAASTPRRIHPVILPQSPLSRAVARVGDHDTSSDMTVDSDDDTGRTFYGSGNSTPEMPSLEGGISLTPASPYSTGGCGEEREGEWKDQKEDRDRQPRDYQRWQNSGVVSPLLLVEMMLKQGSDSCSDQHHAARSLTAETTRNKVATQQTPSPPRLLDGTLSQGLCSSTASSVAVPTPLPPSPSPSLRTSPPSSPSQPPQPPVRDELSLAPKQPRQTPLLAPPTPLQGQVVLSVNAIDWDVQGATADGRAVPSTSQRQRQRQQRRQQQQNPPSFMYLASTVALVLETGAGIDDANSAGWTPLTSAAKHGHCIIITTLVEQGAAIEHRNIHGAGPLVVAVREGHIPAARLLLRLGADIEGSAMGGRDFPLAAACRGGNLAMVRALMGHDGGVVDIDRPTAGAGTTPLLIAIQHGSTKVASALLAQGADPNTATGVGSITPLHVAARLCNAMLVTLLLQHRARADACTDYGWYPLHYAACCDEIHIVNALLTSMECADDGSSVWAASSWSSSVADIETPEGKTALLIAAEHGHNRVVDVLLDRGASIDAATEDGETALHIATEEGHGDTVNALLRRGADVYRSSSDGSTALHLAVRGNHENVAVHLLRAGANPGGANMNGVTPLFAAAEHGLLNLGRLLLENGADVDQGTADGWTPLLMAVSSDQLSFVRLLLEAGGNGCKSALDGTAPLHVAVQGGNFAMMVLLCEYDDGAGGVNQVKANGETPLFVATRHDAADIVEYLLECGADVQETTDDGWAPLHIAASLGYESLVSILLAFGASPGRKTDSGVTPGMFAASFGHASVLQLLHDAGADLGGCSNVAGACIGQVPAWWAAHKGHVACLRVLRECGVELRCACDGEGRTPLQVAEAQSQYGCVAFLKGGVLGRSPLPGEVEGVGVFEKKRASGGGGGGDIGGRGGDRDGDGTRSGDDTRIRGESDESGEGEENGDGLERLLNEYSDSFRNVNKSASSGKR